jgi:predicted MFS family arabinose efflux permease
MAAPASVPPPGGSSAPLPFGTLVKLCVMMFLQFFIWGAWFEIGFSYIPGLKFAEPWMNAMVFNAFNIGSLVALFFSTQFADRKFAAEKFLAVSHLIGGLAIGGLFFLQTPVGTQPRQFNATTVTEKGDLPGSGKGKMADGTSVTVENVTTAEKEEEFWKEFAEKRAKADRASELTKKAEAASGDEKAKLDDELKALGEAKDPAFPVTFTVTTLQNGTITGDAKAPLANFWLFFLLMLVHSIFYVPTISITNSIAFTAFTNPEKQFGPVRVWGTIGWIAASWPFIFILADWAAVQATGKTGVDMLGTALGTPLGGAAALDGKKYVFLVAGIASLVLAAFSLTLPHTPPKPARGEDSLAWLKAMKLLRHMPILVLFVVTFIDAAVHQSYFVWVFDFLADKVGIPTNWVGATTKIGQVAEVLTMLILGWVLKNLGWKWTMVIGVLGHAARFAVFAFFPEKPPVIAVIALHGVCYAFFFATVYIFVDKTFPKDVRSSAQGLFNVLILGVGPFVANTACSFLAVMAKTPEGKLDYPLVFQVSMFAALIGAALLVVGFHPKEKTGQG